MGKIALSFPVISDHLCTEFINICHKISVNLHHVPFYGRGDRGHMSSKGHFEMIDFDETATSAGRIELDYLAQDLSFMSRVLRAHVKALNADFDRENDTISGSIALLSLIGLNPGISQSDLAATVVLKKSAVTKIISELGDRGLVLRGKPEADRRYNALTLSPEGQAQWERLRDQMQQRQDQLLATLSQRDRDRLFQLIGKLIAYYAEQAAGANRRTSLRLG
ncbi:MAG: MarR family winged helix-turn-helix transcriptional regulator [Paracoccus sp. (in: a-proteobacteria)]